MLCLSGFELCSGWVPLNNYRGYHFADFVVSVNEKKNRFERYIAIRVSHVNRFNAKWKKFTGLINGSL